MDAMELRRLSSDEYELCLKDILSLIKPSEDDRVKRLNMINDLATLVQTVGSLQGAVVKPFGSFVSNLYTRWGDLDISVEVSHDSHISAARNRKQSLLRELMRALRRRGVALTFQFIPQARVPLLKFESSYQKISCDVSIDNHLGHIKSKILHLITDMDKRFRDMVLLTKEWAKAQHINNPKSGTLNSFSLCLLVIFHFQTCDPAILPPLKEIYGGNISDDITGTRLITERNVEDVCAENIAKFRSQSFGSRNRSSLHELLISFFQKFSRIDSRASGEAICTYTGRWERITSNPRWAEKPFKLLVEDPFERPENAARAVGLKELLMISHAFRDASSQISSFHAKNYMLTNFVRSTITPQVPSRTENMYTANGGNGFRSGPPKVGQTHHVSIPNDTRFQNGRHYTYSQNGGQYTHPQNPRLPEQSQNGGQYGHPRTTYFPEQFQNSALLEQFQNSLKLDWHHPASSSTTVLPGQRAHSQSTTAILPRQMALSQSTSTVLQSQRAQSQSTTTVLPGRRAQSQSTTTILPGRRAQSQSTATILPGRRAQSMQSQQVWMPRYAEQ